MNQEVIFVQTDPAFNIVLKCLTELEAQNRLQVTHYQLADLRDIESNDDDEDRKFVFGGDRLSANHAFGRTASGIVRMCMLEAAGVSRNLWPALGHNAHRRNVAKLQNPLGQMPRDFHLAATKNIARHYWSKYDQLYPHFRIEDKVGGVDLDMQTSMPSMMLIFRENFTEVVEITTTFNATPKENQVFHSYIHVICIVREISPSKEGNDGKFTRRLKELMVPVEIQEEYFESMTKVKEENGWQQLLHSFAKLNVGDTNE